MSRRLQDLFWDIDLSPTEQLVAQRLAWHADDATGKCWPGIALICAKTGLKERAVQMAVKALKQAGHITREEARGLGVVYFVHPRTKCAPRNEGAAEAAQGTQSAQPAPAADAPPVGEAPQQVHPRTSRTPAADSATPAADAPKEVRKPSPKHGDASADAEPAITGQRGRRIAPDWQPTKPVPNRVAKVVDGWPPGRLDDVLDEFRAYWLAEAGKIASKLDWDLTWHNRLRAVIAHDRRQEERDQRRHGNRPHHNRSSGWAARPGMAGVEPASLDDDEVGRDARR